MSDKIRTSKRKLPNTKQKKLHKKTIKNQNKHTSWLTVFWKKEKNYITWGFALLLVLIGCNIVVISNKIDEKRERNAVITPRSNQNIAVMKFAWSDISMNDTMYKPANGYKIVMIDTNILNLSARSIWLAPTVESYITDDSGIHYGMAIAEVETPFTAGAYDPQQNASGQLTYAIPESFNNPEWCYKLADSNGGGAPICIAINQYSKVTQ